MKMTANRATGLPAILPTHSCFDDALDFFEVLGDDHVMQHESCYCVVHAVCIGRASGKPYAHAWVEDRITKPGAVYVWQRGTVRATGEDVYWALERGSFFELYQVQPDRMTRYPVPLAAAAMLANGHYGPWRPELRALCNDTPGGRVLGSMSGIAPAAVMKVS